VSQTNGRSTGSNGHDAPGRARRSRAAGGPGLGGYHPDTGTEAVVDHSHDGAEDIELAEFTLEPSAPSVEAPALAQAAGPGLGNLLRELRPGSITGGVSATPLLVLTLIAGLDAYDKSAFGVLGPEIKDYFGVGLTGIGIALTLSSVLGLLAALPIGYLADRVNRVRMSALGAVVLGVFGFFTGIAPTLLFLGIARFGAGLGSAMESAHFSLLSDSYPVKTRPAVFATRQLALNAAQFLGPTLAGVLASVFFWQLPFFLFAIPCVLFAALLLVKVREPVRGEQERREMGASEEVALSSERPATLGESLRIAWGVRSARRIYWSLPFLVGSGGSIGILVGFYYQDKFHIGPALRGLFISVQQPLAIAGVIVGGLISNRLMRYRPGRVITYGGLMATVSGLMFVGLAMSPNVILSVALTGISSFAGAILAPSLYALASMVIPARARGIGLSIALFFAIPGAFVTAPALALGDHFGIRATMLAMVPVFLIGAAILTSAGGQVEADIRAATAAAMAAEVSRLAKEEGQAKLLVARDLDVHYGQVQVLFHVDFEVQEGEIIALLGTNGAGKSTLLRAIAGLTPPSNGAIFYDGEDITHLPSAEHAARGIVMSPGGRGTFPGLTVRENLRLAAWMFRSDDAYVRSATAEVLAIFPVLRERLDEPCGNLSGGEQQMVTLGQAFLSRPRLLMIDELSLGLAPAVVEQLLHIVERIGALGTTIILVEQSVNVALTVARRAVFMEKGEIRFSGATAELMARPDILRSVYLKGSAAAAGPVATSARAKARPVAEEGVPPALEVRDLHKRFGGISAINGVSFTLTEGEILGLIGPNGAGKTTVFDMISGFVEPDSGQVSVFGEDVTWLGPDQRAKLGLQRSFQDARLFPSLTVAENIAVALDRHAEARSTVMAALHLPNVRRSEAKLSRRVERLIELVGVGDFRDKFVHELSTGSRRIVDLACCLAASPKVLLLDEPSSGIAQSEAEELGPLLQRIKFETGCSILLIEHDMPLIMSVSDELLALELGAVVTRGAPHEVVEHPQVVASYLGTSEEAIRRSGSLA